MPLNTTSRYSLENIPNKARLYDINRYKSPGPESRGLQKNIQPININTSANTTVRRNANVVFGQISTAKIKTNSAVRATSQQKGISAYLRNNVTPGRNLTSAQPGALFSLSKSALSKSQRTLAAAGDAKFKSAIQTYVNLSKSVRNTSDLLKRGADVYKKTRRLNPSSLISILSGKSQKSNLSIEIPPTITSLFSRSMTEYLLNSGTNTTSSNIDLFLKSGSKSMIESQLFI